MAGVVRALVLVLAIPALATAGQPNAKPATPAEQYQALLKKYQDLTQLLTRARTDPERTQLCERRAMVSLQFLELAEQNPKDPVAVDALVEKLELDHERQGHLGQVLADFAVAVPQARDLAGEALHRQLALGSLHRVDIREVSGAGERQAQLVRDGVPRLQFRVGEALCRGLDGLVVILRERPGHG